MKKVKDIILNKGDIVYLDTNVRTEILIDGTKIHQKEIAHITKIERPTKIKYMTIYEVPRPILDKKEKEYLEAVLKPFKDKVVYITKVELNISEKAYIFIQLVDSYDTTSLPYFERSTMYKGMEPDREYSIDELRLFRN